MVDRDSSGRAYAALRRAADGVTTNDECEREYPGAARSADRSVRAIETMPWHVYDAQYVHPLTGAHAPHAVGRSLLERCLLFLGTDYEYTWPVDNFTIVRDALPLANMLTLGAAGG